MFRRTWIFLAVFAVVLSGVWYLEGSPTHPLEPQTATPTLQPLLLPGIQDKDISSIEINQKSSNRPVYLQRQNQNWQFTNASDQPVKQGNALELIAQITTIEVIESLNTSNLDSLGLSPAVETITLGISSGSHIVIRVGSPTPTGSGYYVQVDADPPVIVSKGSIASIFDLSGLEAFMATIPTTTVTPKP
jgi:hypothetical protein